MRQTVKFSRSATAARAFRGWQRQCEMVHWKEEVIEPSKGKERGALHHLAPLQQESGRRLGPRGHERESGLTMYGPSRFSEPEVTDPSLSRKQWGSTADRPILRTCVPPKTLSHGGQGSRLQRRQRIGWSIAAGSGLNVSQVDERIH